MSEPFLGEIRVFCGTFAPQGYAMCNGQLLSIAQNTALFSILGTFYGGNGVSNFALPDLRGRAALHIGQGSGLSPYVLGEQGGEEGHTLTVGEMPAHSHAMAAATTETTATPSPSVVLGTPSALAPAYAVPSSLAQLAPNSVSPAYTTGAHENRQPYLVLNYIIALNGIFPSRN
jgi:microcystin-dependent protein